MLVDSTVRQVLAAALLFTFAVSDGAVGQSLEDLEASMRLGALDGPPGAAFGLIQDIAAASDGSFYVLDSRMQALSHHSPSGELLRVVGRSGRGPGEYYVPLRVEVVSGGRVLVFDQGNRRIHIYSSTLDRLGEVSLNRLYYDFCVIGDRLFLQALINGTSIHEVSWDGEIVNSFGEAPSVPESVPIELRPLLQRNLSSGQLLCAPENGLIVHIGTNTPIVEAFGVNGSKKWRVEIPSYRKVEFRVTSRGTIALVPDEKTNSQHTFGSAATMGTSELLVQLAIVDFEHRTVDEGQLDGWVISLSNGSVLRRESLPRVLAIGPNGRQFFVSNAPYPRIAIVEDGS